MINPADNTKIINEDILLKVFGNILNTDNFITTRFFTTGENVYFRDELDIIIPSRKIEIDTVPDNFFKITEIEDSVFIVREYNFGIYEEVKNRKEYREIAIKNINLINKEFKKESELLMTKENDRILMVIRIPISEIRKKSVKKLNLLNLYASTDLDTLIPIKSYDNDTFVKLKELRIEFIGKKLTPIDEPLTKIDTEEATVEVPQTEMPFIGIFANIMNGDTALDTKKIVGYDEIDYFSIDEIFGDEFDLDTLLTFDNNIFNFNGDKYNIMDIENYIAAKMDLVNRLEDNRAKRNLNKEKAVSEAIKEQYKKEDEELRKNKEFIETIKKIIL